MFAHAANAEANAICLTGLTDEELIQRFEFRQRPIVQFLRKFCEKGAELNYVIGVPLNGAATFFPKLPNSMGLGIALGWNYLDGVCALGLGLSQLLDEEDYRQTQTKAKGMLNIISGIQLFVLTYNPAIAAALGFTNSAFLAAPSFALAMCCDAITATIDYCNAWRECHFEGWLEERAKEMAYHQHRIKQYENRKDNTGIDELEKAYLQVKIKQLNVKIETISQDVYARSRVYSGSDSQKKHNVMTILDKYHPVSEAQQDSRNTEIRKSQNDQDVEKDKIIQTKLDDHYKDQRSLVAMKWLSFAGMALFAASGIVGTTVCPPLGIAALVVTSCVAAYYFYKHRNTIKKGALTLCHNISRCGFFGGALPSDLSMNTSSDHLSYLKVS